MLVNSNGKVIEPVKYRIGDKNMWFTSFSSYVKKAWQFLIPLAALSTSVLLVSNFPTAAADGPAHPPCKVKASIDSFDPGPDLVGDQMDAYLSADMDPPQLRTECGIQGVRWKWEVQSVKYRAHPSEVFGDPPAGTAPHVGFYEHGHDARAQQITIADGTQAVLHANFYQAGYWDVVVKTTLTYTGATCADCQNKSATVNIIFVVCAMDIARGTTLVSDGAVHDCEVGEAISLSGGISPTDEWPGDVTPAGNDWFVDGTVAHQWNANANTGQKVPLGTSESGLPGFPLGSNYVENQASIGFFWIKGRGNPTKVYFQENFDEGAYTAGLTSNAKFNPKRPAATLTAVQNTTHILYPAGAGTRLYFADNGVAGIAFTTHPDSNFHGTYTYVQVIESSTRTLTKASDNSVLTWTTSGCDVHYPYPHQNDSPNFLLDPYTDDFKKATVNEQFVMYLFYQPTGGTAVPIRKLSWHWQATATSATDVDGNRVWSVFSSSPLSTDAAPTDSDASDYPSWTQNIQAGSWAPSAPTTP